MNDKIRPVEELKIIFSTDNKFWSWIIEFIQSIPLLQILRGILIIFLV